MRDLVQKCITRTGRAYRPGYGFALAYLSETLNPAHLRDGAFSVVAAAFDGDTRLAPFRKDSDLVAFVSAFGTSERFEDWAIEGAQLVLQAALAGDPNARRVMALCGHPGYDEAV